MKYELSDDEARFIEKYRDLLPEYQAALEEQAKILFDLQTRIIKELIHQD